MTYSFKVLDYTVKLIEEGDSIVRHERSGKKFEPDTLAYWVKACENATHVLDIGAYNGLFSILAHRAGVEWVHAYEPFPMNYQRVRDNCALNDAPIAVAQMAVSDVPGKASFQYNPLVAGMTSGASLLHPSGGTTEKSIEVDTITVDHLASPVDIIKIDVERAEPMVLRGARETLDRCRPDLIVEVLGDDEKAAVLAEIPDYRVELELDERNWVMVPR